MTNLNRLTIKGLPVLLAVLFLASCNKDLEQFPETPAPTPSGLTLTETLASTASDSLYNRLFIKSGLGPTYNNKATMFTMFVPNNDGMKLFISAISGGQIPPGAPDAVFSAFITQNISVANAAGIVSYN